MTSNSVVPYKCFLSIFSSPISHRFRCSSIHIRGGVGNLSLPLRRFTQISQTDTSLSGPKQSSDHATAPLVTVPTFGRLRSPARSFDAVRACVPVFFPPKRRAAPDRQLRNEDRQRPYLDNIFATDLTERESRNHRSRIRESRGALLSSARPH